MSTILMRVFFFVVLFFVIKLEVNTGFIFSMSLSTLENDPVLPHSGVKMS